MISAFIPPFFSRVVEMNYTSVPAAESPIGPGEEEPPPEEGGGGGEEGGGGGEVTFTALAAYPGTSLAAYGTEEIAAYP